MWIFLSLLWALGASPIFCSSFGDCPRKEPPPGVVLVSPGSLLLLTCSGHVFVDGVKIQPKSHSVSTQSTVNSITHNAVLQKQHISTDWEREGPTTPASSPSVSQENLPKSEDEEENEGKRGTKFNIQWKFNSEDMMGDTEGSTLSLSPVRLRDSGRYSCHKGGTQRSSTRVIVAETPETPALSCSKKSPSSKIRCEWVPQTVLKGTTCSLLIRKGQEESFLRVPCSFSTRRSRWWCALDHDEDDKWTRHQAVLCVSSISSSSTSEPFSFRPMHIVKPDAPWNVTVEPEPGLNRPLQVTWNQPHTWKSKARFYVLIYELRYKPVTSMFYQNVSISDGVTRHNILDASAGLDYEVQVRAKSEYEGQWSDWSAPQYGRRSPESEEDLSTTPFPYWYSEGSGSGDLTEDRSVSTDSAEGLSHHYLWMMISISVGLSLIVLVVYITRHKTKCILKLQTLGGLAQCSDSVHPQLRPETVAERNSLLHKTPTAERDRRETEVRGSAEKTEAANLNNTSYFLVPREI